MELKERLLAKKTYTKKDPKGPGDVGKPRICAVCGDKTYTYCSLCKGKDGKNFPFCYFGKTKTINVDGKKKKVPTSAMRFLNYHTPQYFGLCRCDSKAVGIKLNQWEEPTKEKERKWAKYIDKFFLICTVMK